jgi:hypothetical protein
MSRYLFERTDGNKSQGEAMGREKKQGREKGVSH